MKKLTYENWRQLQPYIELANYNEYNSNAMTLLMWSNRYEVFFKIEERFAIVYSKMPNMKPIWFMPFCRKENRKEAISEIQKISLAEGIPFEIHSMVKEFKDWLLETYPMQFIVWDCYNARDYIYDRKQQETLVGKKMQKRRNHYNAFLKQYETRTVYKPLEKEDIPNIYVYLEEWKQTKAEEEKDTIQAEESGIHYFFEHFDELAIFGGCIYIDGKLEAFNIASRLSKDTVQIHVEKANKNIRGVYIAILKRFLETLDDEVVYVNREDDMGLPELRKAKSDMQPIHKIQKFGSAYQTLSIIQADTSWLTQIKKLWLASFPEENDASTTFLFDTFYHPEDTWLLVSEGELLSMAQFRKMDVSIQGQSEQVSFLYGVATDEEYSGCGYMKLLLKKVLEKLAKQENYALLQAYNWDIYRSLGFQEAYKSVRYKIDKQAYPKQEVMLQDTIDVNEMIRLYQEYTKDKDGYRIRDEVYYQQQFLPYVTFWNQKVAMVVDKKGQSIAYIVYSDEEDLILHECIYESEEALHAVLGCFADEERKVFVQVDQNTELQGRRKEETCMMVKELNTQPFPKDNLFIHEEL